MVVLVVVVVQCPWEYVQHEYVRDARARCAVMQLSVNLSFTRGLACFKQSPMSPFHA